MIYLHGPKSLGSSWGVLSRTPQENGLHVEEGLNANVLKVCIVGNYPAVSVLLSVLVYFLPGQPRLLKTIIWIYKKYY